MFVLPGLGLLVIVLITRPQEFVPLLAGVPLLHMAAAAALLGYVIDIRIGRLRPQWSPLLWVGYAFLGWAGVCDLAAGGESLPQRLTELVILGVLFTLMAGGIQRLRSFRGLAGLVIALCAFLAVVGIEQRYAAYGCVAVDPVYTAEGAPDGRPCETAAMCVDGSGDDFRCERVGMFQTFSIEGRVRYRGELHDPNELALWLGLGGIALGLGLWFGRVPGARRGPRDVALAIAMGLCLACIYFTQSRGGLLVVVIIAGTFAIARWGRWAVIAGVVIAPMAFMVMRAATAARDTESAAMSTALRYEAWAAGLTMMRGNPLVGVGHRQFGEHHYMTAHNSYVLAAGELGFLGLVLFLALLAQALKIAYVGYRELGGIAGAEVPRAWALALLAGGLGLVFQIGTLSFSYHSVLWIYLGLVAAWHGAVVAHLPAFSPRLRLGEVLVVGVVAAGFVTVLLPLYLRLKHAL